MTHKYVPITGLALAVGSLAVKVVSPGSIYEINQQTWDKAMESPDAGDSYELQTGHDTKQKFPWLSWEGAEEAWSAEIRFTSDVPTKDPGLFQAGTSLSLRPVGNEDLDTYDYSDQWYLCLNFLRVKKGSQAQRNDETCFSQLSFECRANLTDAAISSFDWANGTASSPCHNFKLPNSCSGQVEPEYYVTGGNLTPWDPNALRYSSESHPPNGLDGTAAFNTMSTQVWAMQIIWGWNKDLNPTLLNHSNDGLHSWTGARNSLLCLRAGQGVPLSTAVVLRKPSLSIIALTIACVVLIINSM